MLLIAEKKYFIQIIFLNLSLRELVKNARACLASFKRNSPETRHVAICDECRWEPMSVRLSCNIWIRNERVLAQALQFTVAG